MIQQIIISMCQMNCNDMYALSTTFQNFKYLKMLCLMHIQMDKGAFIALVSLFIPLEYLILFNIM